MHVNIDNRVRIQRWLPSTLWSSKWPHILKGSYKIPHIRRLSQQRYKPELLSFRSLKLDKPVQVTDCPCVDKYSQSANPPATTAKDTPTPRLWSAASAGAEQLLRSGRIQFALLRTEDRARSDIRTGLVPFA